VELTGKPNIEKIISGPDTKGPFVNSIGPSITLYLLSIINYSLII
jgi:hypothetical protein